MDNLDYDVDNFANFFYPEFVEFNTPIQYTLFSDEEEENDDLLDSLLTEKNSFFSQPNFNSLTPECERNLECERDLPQMSCVSHFGSKMNFVCDKKRYQVLIISPQQNLKTISKNNKFSNPRCPFELVQGKSMDVFEKEEPKEKLKKTPKKKKKKKRKFENISTNVFFGENNNVKEGKPKKKRRKKSRGMFLTAAEEVLRRHHRPMKRKEIMNYIEENNMIETSGLTPWSTLSAQIYIDMKNENSIFSMLGKGNFVLKEW